MRNVTGSRLPILQHCQYWAREDIAHSEPPQQGAAAGRGVTMHDAIERGDLSGVEFEDLEATQRGIAYLNQLRAAGWVVETEVPLALNYLTGAGRRMKSSGHRDYSDLRPGEVPLTVDYLAVCYERVLGAVDVVKALEVGDWKSGYGAHVERASENWQTGAAAAALSAMYGDCSVTVKVHYLDADRIDAWTFNAMEAQRFGIWIRNRFELIPGSMPHPGDHCRYCTARLSCPSTQQAIQALLPDKVTWSLERISPENDAAMAMALPALKAAVEAVDKALKDRNKAGLPLPNGKVWKPILQTRQGYDTKRMVEALGEKAEQFRTKTEFEVFRQVKP
jgi:hypothetical protein